LKTHVDGRLILCNLLLFDNFDEPSERCVVNLQKLNVSHWLRGVKKEREDALKEPSSNVQLFQSN